ncbi:MAG: amphi-Trp domain-containing protein [Planctomycetota bacterium]
MEANGEFTHEALIDTPAVSAYLRALADGFEHETLRFSDKKGEMVLRPHGLVNFEVQSVRDGDRVQLSVRFDWKEQDSSSDSRNGTLHIEVRDKP